MEHRVHFIVAELGKDRDDFTLYIWASLAEQERKMIAERTRAASSSFEPRQTAAFIVIWKFGLAFASLSSSTLLVASTCIPSTSAAARRTDRNSSRSASDGSGTSKAATVFALSG
jgi:hypothetical protein